MPLADPSVIVALTEHFAAVEDSRVERTKFQPFVSFSTMARCTVISGAESRDDIAEVGETKVAWLKTFLNLPHGDPSHDTFSRVFTALGPTPVQTCFVRWTRPSRQCCQPR